MASKDGLRVILKGARPGRATTLLALPVCSYTSFTQTQTRSYTSKRSSTKPSHSHSHSQPRPNSRIQPSSALRKSRTLRRTVIFTSILGLAFYYLSTPSTPQSTVLNDTTFVPYTIASRTNLSPSSFVLTVIPHTPNPSPPYLLPGTNRWRHPLWSVEFKQPEVQISRHYTPLPPSSSQSSGTASQPDISEEDGALRFYIRAVGDGEMSRYLNRLREGQTVHLRGPHVGFDLVRRLGACKNIVFLAGGTGVVPGMQAARVALDGYEDTKVSLLWAVRQREEIQHVGRSDPSAAPSRPWWDFTSSSRDPVELDPALQNPSPVAAQLADMKKQYGSRLSVQLVVDDENTVFNPQHVQKALHQICEGDESSAPSNPGVGCLLHDQKRHETASEFELSSPSCRCTPIDGTLPGKNLFIVSGPDGFVTHYAGAKRWLGGRHTQGPVGGVAGEIQHKSPQLERDWLVLKL